jgi:hypothetical protein
VSWNALQTVFLADTLADVLLIMDCCNALGAFQRSSSVRSGTAVLWAACGTSSTTPVRGPSSFTESLIAVLENVKGEGRDVDELNGDLFERLRSAQLLYRQPLSEPACMVISRSQDGRRIRIKKLLQVRIDTQTELAVSCEIKSQTGSLPEPALARIGSEMVAEPNTLANFRRLESNVEALGPSRLLQQHQHTDPHASHKPFRHTKTPPEPSSPLGQPGASTSRRLKLKIKLLGRFLGGRSRSRTHGAASQGEGFPTTAPRPPKLIGGSDSSPSTSGDLVAEGRWKPESSPAAAVRLHRRSRPPLRPWTPDTEAYELIDLLKFDGFDSHFPVDAAASPDTLACLLNSGPLRRWLSGSGSTPEPLLWVLETVESGNSTFLATLMADPDWRSILHQWPKRMIRVLTASFRFESTDDGFGASLEAFLRSILVQIMEQAPDTARFVARAFTDCPRYDLRERLLHVLQALTEAYDSPMLEGPYCILIDEIDKCEEQDLILHLVAQLLRAPELKICASSRLYPPDNHFRQPPIILHHPHRQTPSEEMKRPMGHAVRCRRPLRSVHNPHGADGSLLTRMPQYEIDNILALSQITRRALLIARVSEVEIFDIHDGESVHPAMTLAQLFFALDDGMKIPETVGPANAARHDKINSLARQLTRLAGQLNRETDGLFKVNIHRPYDPISYARDATSTHRWSTDCWVDRNFDAELALLRGIIMEIRTMDEEYIKPFKGFNIDSLSGLPYWIRIEQAIRYSHAASSRHGPGCDSDISHALDILDNTVQTQLASWSKSDKLDQHWSSFLPLGHPRRSAEQHDDFLSYATSCGLWTYVSRKLADDTQCHKPGKPLLFYAIQPQPQYIGDPAMVETIRVLFQRGANPNELFEGDTPWSHFLKHSVLPHADGLESDYLEHLWEIYSLFIKYDADVTVAEVVAEQVAARRAG